MSMDMNSSGNGKDGLVQGQDNFYAGREAEYSAHLSGGGGLAYSLAEEIKRERGVLSFTHPWVKVLVLLNKLGLSIERPHAKIRVRTRQSV